jgi:muramidase (phage lysozyme)
MKPNRKAVLDMIAKCEGTGDCYNALFGYDPVRHPDRVFENGYLRHPNIKFPFTQTDGTQNYSTAAGRYQFIFHTWQQDAEEIGAPDFSPQWQDEAALYEIEKHQALDDVDAGRLQDAIDKISGIWASLPASHYPQPRRDYAFASAAFTDAGGTLA